MDYKIAAKAIANRLLQVLPSVIHSDQTCGVRCRHSIVNSRLLQDIVTDVNQRGLGGAVLSLDQEKAFDRVDWAFLLRVLQTMNFGPSFCHWIQLFYTQISSSVLVNGEQSASFCVSRGVRQGCPLSPLLYVIMAETLACAIRSDPLIDGFSLPGRRRIKLCQYADDTSIVVMSDVSLLQVFSVFNRYELASGAKLNVTKSHGLLVGSWASRSNLPIALDWSSSSITVMGTTLSNVADDSSCWTPPLDQLRLTLADWQQRHLSYHGRALVVNSLGLSPLWYLASFRTMPVLVVTAINACVFSFLWHNKWEKIARSSLTQRVGQGGLNVVDVGHKVSSLHVMWVRRLLADPDHSSMYLFRHSLSVAFAGRSLENILLLPAPSPTAMNLLPPFFRSVMSSWFRLSRCLDARGIMIRGPGSSFCPVSSLSVRFVYKQLSRLDHREHRCVALYRGWNLSVDWPLVWLNLCLWRFTRPIRDTNWLVAHGVLPTADRLNRFGMRIDPSCHYGQPESLVHLFVECPVAKRLFAWYQTLVCRAALRLPRPSPSQLLLGYDGQFPSRPCFRASLALFGTVSGSPGMLFGSSRLRLCFRRSFRPSGCRCGLRSGCSSAIARAISSWSRG